MTKHFITLLLPLLLMPGVHAAPPAVRAMPAQAVPGDPESDQAVPDAPPLPMKPAQAKPTGPVVPVCRSRYAVLVDVATGKVLWQRNAGAQRPIASTTKMLTAILLLERGHLDDIVTAPNGVQLMPDSSLHLKPGEKITLRDLLYAMLLRSANDTAIAGAHYLSGSVPAFAVQMNEKAKEIGATHSHFVTPNGLPAPGHYSTAGDLAKIACYALNNLPQFNAIVRTQTYKVSRSMDKRDVWVKNTASKFLKTFPGADGVKTGYIREAGHCFVGSATRDGWRLVAVALDSPKCREDVESLLQSGFTDYAPYPTIHKGDPVGVIDIPSAAAPVKVGATDDISIVTSRWKPVPAWTVRLTPLSPLPQAPIPAGTKLGTFTVLVGGRVQATGDAVAADSVAVKPMAAFLKTSSRFGLTLLKIVGALGAAAILCAGGLMLYGRTAAKGARRRRSRVAPGVRGVDRRRPSSR